MNSAASSTRTKRLRLGLLLPSCSRLGGGVSEAVLAHAHSIGSTGQVEVVVFTLRDAATEEDRGRWGEIPLIIRDNALSILAYSPHLVGDLVGSDIDILHLHGIWQYPSAAGAAWAKRLGRPYVISPHGMLDPWILSRGRWKKSLAKAVYERRSWARASLFHALTDAEAADIRAAEPGAEVVTIPNGVAAASQTAGTCPPSRIGYLGRIHPKKNIGALVDAWRSLRAEGLLDGMRLSLAGWGEPDHVADLTRMLAAAAEPTIEFVGSIVGEAKAEFVASSRFLVLPSLSEGLPMAMLEAWAAGVPTLMSEHCHLGIGFEQGAAFCAGTDPATIREALRTAVALSDDGWRSMSAAALRLAAGPYAPQTVQAKWLDTYRGLVATR